MKKETRKYLKTRFPVETIRNATKTFKESFGKSDEDRFDQLNMTVELDSGGERGHDSEEEFFADYRVNHRGSYLGAYMGTGPEKSSFRVSVTVFAQGTLFTTIHVETPERAQALAVLDVFESAKEKYRLADPPKPQPKIIKPVIFIGHGGNPSWRDLKDHLHDKHHFEVEAYEIGARAGHAIRDILQSMLNRSSMAFLVMTAEDEMSDGGMNPRLNVVHEAGLFQGHLGFNRAVVLLEESATEFSNIKGLEQIRFKNIREVFGDVVATIRREFPAAI